MTEETPRPLDRLTAYVVAAPVAREAGPQLNGADDDYHACLAFAVSLAGADLLDDEVPPRLEELELLPT